MELCRSKETFRRGAVHEIPSGAEGVVRQAGPQQDLFGCAHVQDSIAVRVRLPKDLGDKYLLSGRRRRFYIIARRPFIQNRYGASCGTVR